MRARRKRRAVLVLREDSDWLREFHPRPKDLLLRMASRGALIKLGAGRYAIPTLGSDAAAYNAWQPMLHGRLAPLGDYYLGFFSALEEHRLTDLSEPFATVLVGFASRQLMDGQLVVAGRPLRAARTRRPVFAGDLGVESRAALAHRAIPTQQPYPHARGLPVASAAQRGDGNMGQRLGPRYARGAPGSTRRLPVCPGARPDGRPPDRVDARSARRRRGRPR